MMLSLVHTKQDILDKNLSHLQNVQTSSNGQSATYSTGNGGKVDKAWRWLMTSKVKNANKMPSWHGQQLYVSLPCLDGLLY